MRLAPISVLLLLVATAGCAKSAESKGGGAGKATDSQVEDKRQPVPVEGAGSAAPPVSGTAGAPTRGSGSAETEPRALADDGGKKPVPKDAKGPAGAPSTKTSWEIVDPDGTRHGPDGSFSLEITGPASVAPGAEATFVLSVTPGEGYKINYCEPGEADCNDFPVSLKLTATDGVDLPKTALGKADLTAFDKKHLVLEFKATASAAGSYTVPGKYKFAVCQADACLPRRLDLWFVLAAK